MLAAVVLLGSSLSGCSTAGAEQDGVILDREENDVEPCAVREPVPVESLDDSEESGELVCDLTGVEVVFPGGESLLVSEGTRSRGSGESDPQYFVSALGVYGTVAAVRPPGGDLQYWGTEEGVRRAREGRLFGD